MAIETDSGTRHVRHIDHQIAKNGQRGSGTTGKAAVSEAA